MKLLASLLVVLLLILIIRIPVMMFVSELKTIHSDFKRSNRIIMIGLSLIIAMTSVICFGNYSWPFQRQVKHKLHTVLKVSGDQVLDYPGQALWAGAYEQYGMFVGSRDFNTENPIEFYDWPEMDFKNYSYIITYGQKIGELSYNVWDVIDSPYYTGAYAGSMELDEKFTPDEVYIYQIPKMRIANDYRERHSDKNSREYYSIKAIFGVILILALTLAMENRIYRGYKRYVT